MNWQNIGMFLKEYGLLGLAITGITGGIYWASSIDTKLSGIVENGEKLQNRVKDLEGSISGVGGIHVQLKGISGAVKGLEKSNKTQKCRFATSYTRDWYRGFELELWAKPIDELSNPQSSEFQRLSIYIQQFESSLGTCSEGETELRRLRFLKAGLEQYNATDYLRAYKSFRELDLAKSLPQRFLGAAKGHQADDEPDDPLLRRQSSAHLRSAYNLAQQELASSAKDRAVRILECNAYASGNKQELREGAECYIRLAKEGIKPSFAYVEAASFYATIEEYKKAIEMLEKYKVEPIKIIGSRSLKRYQSLEKLRQTKYKKQYLDVLKDPRVPR